MIFGIGSNCSFIDCILLLLLLYYSYHIGWVDGGRGWGNRSTARQGNQVLIEGLVWSATYLGQVSVTMSACAIGTARLICNNECMRPRYSQALGCGCITTLHWPGFIYSLGNTESDRLPLPGSKPQSVLAYDNIDRQEEVLSGAGTSHWVNGIIVQPTSMTCAPPKPKIIIKNKTRNEQSNHLFCHFQSIL